MATIYTLNGKVLKNTNNGKWLIKNESPRFVMDASNAIFNPVNVWGTIIVYVGWEVPTYPDVYNGGGKQYILVNNNVTAPNNTTSLAYSNNIASGGSATAIGTVGLSQLGTSTGTMLSNTSNFGAYFVWPNPAGTQGWFRTLEETQAYMANVSITIVDP